MKCYKITLNVQSLLCRMWELQLDQAGSSCSDKHMDSVAVNVDVNVLSSSSCRE